MYRKAAASSSKPQVFSLNTADTGILNSLLILKKEAIMDAIRSVGLDPSSKKHVGKYSLGMRQRLGLAQAIMEDPDLLILDEPMNGLDREGVSDMRKYLIDLKNKGITLIIASHSTEDIETLCDTVFEMEKGIITKVR